MGNLYMEGLPGSLRAANYLCPCLARDREAFKGERGPNFHINRLHCGTQYYQMDHMQVTIFQNYCAFPVYLYGLTTSITGEQIHAKKKKIDQD